MVIDCRILPLLLLVVPISCASAGEEPRTGDISFRVTWTGTADVDLYVKSPLGESVNYGGRRAPSGGELDIDCNFRSEEFEESLFRGMCDAPMENIYWPVGAAPHGEYEFWLLLPNPEGMTGEDAYTLEVRFGERIIWSGQGMVSDLQDHVPVYRVSYPSGEVIPNR
jgi:hypothetical protein